MPDIVVLEPDRVNFHLEPPRFLSECAVGVMGGIVVLGCRDGRAILESYARRVLSGEFEAIAAVEEGKLGGLLLWRFLPWDSSIVGRNLAGIVIACGSHIKELLDFWKRRACASGIEYATMRFVNWYRERMENEEAREIDTEVLEDALQEAGFLYIEDVELFERKLGRSPGRMEAIEGIAIEEAYEEDFQGIAEVASKSYIYDRFHRDAYFSGDEADRIHRKWVLDSLSGRADIVLAAKDRSGSILGYITAIVTEGGRASGWIDMLAVRKEARKKGVGEALLSEMCRRLAGRGIGAAALGTQAFNKPAISLYRKLEFKPFGGLKTYRIVLKEAS